MEENQQQPQRSLLTPILIGLLVVAAFFIGTLYQKVQNLEGNSGKGVAAGQQAKGNAKAGDTAGAGEEAPAVGDVTPVSDKDHIRGNANADIVLVEYSDYECPFCKRFHPTMQQVMKEYGNKVAWVYRHYPLPFHANAQKEAEAAECIAELGGNDAFWKFTDAVYERTTGNGTGFALTALQPLAVELGINGRAFQQCLDSGKYAQTVKDDMTSGQNAGINGTPGTIILTKGGQKELIPGALPFDQVKPMLDKYLK